MVVSLRAQHEPKSFPSSPRRIAAGEAAATGGDRVAGFAVPSPSPGLPPPPAALLLHREACRRATATPFDCSTQCQGWPGGAEAELLLLRCLRRRAQGVRRNARESLVQSWSVATSTVEDLVVEVSYALMLHSFPLQAKLVAFVLVWYSRIPQLMIVVCAMRLSATNN